MCVCVCVCVYTPLQEVGAFFISLFFSHHPLSLLGPSLTPLFLMIALLHFLQVVNMFTYTLHPLLGFSRILAWGFTQTLNAFLQESWLFSWHLFLSEFPPRYCERVGHVKKIPNKNYLSSLFYFILFFLKKFSSIDGWREAPYKLPNKKKELSSALEGISIAFKITLSTLRNPYAMRLALYISGGL